MVIKLISISKHELFLMGKVVCIMLLCFSCNSRENMIERKQIGEYSVEAVFKNDSIIDGMATYYSDDGKMVSRITYQDGKKNGVAKTYFPDGKIKDSLFYINDHKHGFGYKYDPGGRLSSMYYYYYGLRMGPQIFNLDSRRYKYFFSDFNKRDLVDCTYDSLGNLKDVSFYKMNLSVSKGIVNDSVAVDLFAYLPEPPQTTIEFRVGLTNANQRDKYLFTVDNNRVFIDTILPYPPNGEHYFISASIAGKDGVFNKVFLEEFRH